MNQNSLPSLCRRAVTAVGLLAIGLIHTLDLPGTLHQTPYLGAAYIGLIVASVLAAIDAVADPEPRWRLLALVIGVAPLVAFLLSRTVGLPADTGDIGNWFEPLGLASMFVEGSVALIVAHDWLDQRVVRGRDRAADVARPAAIAVRRSRLHPTPARLATSPPLSLYRR